MRAAHFARRNAVFLVPVIVYALLVLLGVTNSNVGVSGLREDAAVSTGDQIGSSQGIRSDEWGTESPIWLGQMARGGAEDSTPLSVSNDLFAQLPSGPATAIVFLDGTVLALGQWFPNEILFAAKWWLPSLLLFLGLPLWFRQITGRARWGYFAASLIFLAPGTMWWSGRPVNTLGFVAAGCALAIYAYHAFGRRQWVRGVVAVVAAGALLARTPTYYQPLAIVIGIPLVLATAVFLLAQSSTRRHRLLSLTAIAASGLVWTALVFWENRDAFAAGLATVYPGDRQSTGGAVDIGLVFGATALGWVKGFPINQTEMSSGFTVLLAVLVVLAASQQWRGRRPLAAALIPLLVCAAFWLSWCTLDWGSFGAAIPLVNRVPSTRAMLGVGYLATIAFALFMSQWQPSRRWSVPALAAAVAAFLTGYAGSALGAGQIPQLTVAMIWISALVTGAVVFLLVRWPLAWWTWTATIGAAALLVASSTPLLFGLGDLRGSETARSFLAWGEQARTEGVVWASESQDVDSLMMATGTPTLSARQQIGPDDSAWRELDPSGEYEEMWNRGGLHIQFAWNDSEQVTFTQPTPDIVIVSGSPCEISNRVPDFRYAVSASPLDLSCTTPVDSFEWSGIDYTVYRVAATG